MNQLPLEPDRLWQATAPRTEPPRDPLRLAGAPASIAKLLKVVVGSALAALLSVATLVYFYGPDGSSSAALLFTPTMLERDSFTALDSTQRAIHYSKEKLLLRRAGLKRPLELTVEEYAQLYEQLRRDEPVRFVTPALEQRFEELGAVSVLNIMARAIAHSSRPLAEPGPLTSVQQIEFLDQGREYRLLVRKPKGESWHYFRHHQPLRLLLDPLGQQR